MQRLYDLLPPAAQSGAASLRGFYLCPWRYGSETERLVAEAQERESWTEDRWRRWREERPGRLLRRAATLVPYYRRQWEERRRGGDRASFERLENWPILRNETLGRGRRSSSRKIGAAFNLMQRCLQEGGIAATFRAPALVTEGKRSGRAVPRAIPEGRA